MTGLLLLAFASVACGQTTNEPPPPNGPVVPGDECADVGATAPAEDGCNACVCGSDVWSCTELGCPPVPQQCPEGAIENTADACNSCTCTSGSWDCTEAACPPMTECTPGENTGLSCYSCQCRLNGTWDCIDDCPKPVACTEGEVKTADDGCNTCTCTAEGSWACTDTVCEVVMCGGFAGDTCGEDEYCAYEANEGGCGVLDASAVCKTRPTACTAEEAPVCGCDGETYSNACLANLAGTGVYTDQPCLPDE